MQNNYCHRTSGEVCKYDNTKNANRCHRKQVVKIKKKKISKVWFRKFVNTGKNLKEKNANSLVKAKLRQSPKKI